MANLKLRLNLSSDEPLGTAEVVANIFPSDRSAPGDLRARLRDMTIPAGDEDAWAYVDVPPGNYEVQVALPSGEMLMRDVQVTDDTDEPQEVSLEASSPYEYLSMQYFQGNVGRRDTRGPGDDEWILQSLVRGATQQAPGSLPRETPGAAPSEPVQVTWCPDPKPPDMAELAWDLVYDIIRDRMPAASAEQRFLDQLPAADTASPVQPYFEDSTVRAFRFTHGGLIRPDGTRPGSLSAWDEVTPERRYAIARDGSATRLVCAPVPWFDLRNPDRETGFEIMSPLGSAGVTCAIRDTQLGAIIGYLTSGAMQNARLLLKPARDMLFEKVANPLGAAAGAYLMVTTSSDRSDQSWHHWVENLREHFAWIPDGAIALAKLRLNHQNSDEDVNESLEVALEAYHRGLPFYAMGMRWLLDILTSFADDEDFSHRHDEIRHCLRRVRVVARRTNYQQAFTSVLLSSTEG